MTTDITQKPRRRRTMWIVIGATLGSVLLIFAVVCAWMVFRINRETVSALTTQNPDGKAGTALIVYHPGMSDFQERVTKAFAEGLTSGGWRVEMTTASVQAPTDMHNYQLLVVGSPIYASATTAPLNNYLQRLGDLQGKRTVILLTGAGDSKKAEEATQERIQTAHGCVVRTLALYTERPNQEGRVLHGSENQALGIEMAKQAGIDIAREEKTVAHE